MDLLTPKLRFQLNQLRHRWERWLGTAQQTSQAVFTEQKMCPACRALVERGDRQCPYCGEPLRVLGTGPAARILSRIVPTDTPFSALLLLINLLMFGVEVALSGGNLLRVSGRATSIGASAPLGYILATHQYWRWVTGIFLHGGLLHIAFNMWALFDLGPLVESAYGRAKFLLVFIVTGTVGNLVASYFGHLTVGASGSLFGLLGVMITYGSRRHDQFAQQLRSQALRWAIYAFAMGMLLPGTDNFAHLGGVLSGVAFGWLVSDHPPLTEGSIRYWQVVQWGTLSVMAAAFLFMAMAPPAL